MWAAGLACEAPRMMAKPRLAARSRCRTDVSAGERNPCPCRGGMLTTIRLIHTLAWFSIESCMAYVLWAGFTGRRDRRVGTAAGVVAGETLIFAANRFRCPLTDIAERVGAEHGAVTDIYLPRWFAHNLPAIHVPLILLAGYLHRASLRRA
jgi:hypothetical protein